MKQWVNNLYRNWSARFWLPKCCIEHKINSLSGQVMSHVLGFIRGPVTSWYYIFFSIWRENCVGMFSFLDKKRIICDDSATGLFRSRCLLTIESNHNGSDLLKNRSDIIKILFTVIQFTIICSHLRTQYKNNGIIKLLY